MHELVYSNEEVYEARTMFNSILARNHHWTGHTLRHYELLCNITEGRMVGNLQEAEEG